MGYMHTCWIEGGMMMSPAGPMPEQMCVILKDDTIHKWGRKDVLLPVLVKYQEAAQRMRDAGFDDETDPVMFTFNENAFTYEETIYVLRRMTEFTATGFVAAFQAHVLQPDFKEWLHAEMERIPIELYEKQWK